MARRSASDHIHDATIAYYQAMTAAEQAEDDEWSRLGEAVFTYT
jgi:hypothetical protein